MKTFLVTYSTNKYSDTITEGILASNAYSAEQAFKSKGDKVVIYEVVERTQKSYAKPMPPLDLNW